MNGGILVASSLVEMFYRIVLKIINRKPFDWWGLRQLLLTDERAQIEHPRYLFNFLSHEFMSFGEALLFLFKFVAGSTIMMTMNSYNYESIFIRIFWGCLKRINY
jgi:hypothetical protein